MVSRDLKHLDYTSQFYQIKDDDFDFKSYDEFMEMEDTIERSLSFGMEWTADKINVLHPEQTGVHVACFDLSSLLQHGPDVCLDCYVTYRVATIEKECVELQLNVGPLTIPRTQLYSTALSIQLFSEGETYRDLLTITCTSEQLAIEISYKSAHVGIGLKDFFVGRLGFAEVLSSVEDRSLLYCGDNSYWQGTLIRLDRLIDQRMKAKLYCRFLHQLATLVQSIYSDYEEICTVRICATNENGTASELKQRLLEELSTKLDQPTNADECRRREFCTDIIYCSLSTIARDRDDSDTS
ncbi:hypothetical protein AND_002030 [Anopheles darlingi]|uniref:Uncharacterized protein n=1 Tax=Anopheles darlingi TaxID=43151 RepID=W5JP68_ANODA|nr:hypothetical protein AND_002030 [Anopheles darlingi]